MDGETGSHWTTPTTKSFSDLFELPPDVRESDEHATLFRPLPLGDALGHCSFERAETLPNRGDRARPLVPNGYQQHSRSDLNLGAGCSDILA